MSTLESPGCFAVLGSTLFALLMLVTGFFTVGTETMMEPPPPVEEAFPMQEGAGSGEFIVVMDSIYAGIPQETTDEGYPRLGEADAPITVEIYSSFGCSHCQTLNWIQLPPMLDEVRAGDVQIIYKPVTTIANVDNYAVDGARLALCAGQQNAFWDIHDVVFSWQGVGNLTSDIATEMATPYNLNTDLLLECFQSNEVDYIFGLAEKDFAEASYTGTPTVLVNGEVIDGYAGLSEMVEAMAADLE